jgi:pimeloyl-ACP methyl ester carboxylesterase
VEHLNSSCFVQEFLTNQEFLLTEGVQFFEIEGAKIAYDFQPSAQTTQKLLILINGYQRTRSDYRVLRKKIEKACPHTATLSLDNRYCGQTLSASLNLGKPVCATNIGQMANDTFALAEIYRHFLNLSQFSVLGISMGGMIAQSLAAHCAHKVQHLFLVSTTAGGAGRTWPVTHQEQDPSCIKYEQNLYQDLESVKEHMRLYFGSKFLNTSPFLFELMCKNILKNHGSRDDQDHRSQGARAQFDAARDFDGVAHLPSIYSKTFLFSGDEDHIVPLENSYYLKQHIAHSSLQVYPRAGHLLLIEEPEIFSKDLMAALES